MSRPEDLSPEQRRDLVVGFENHETFCAECLRLPDRTGSRVPLAFWPSQRKLEASIQRQIRRGQPVRQLVLKTRRSGFTVGSCSQIFRRVPFFPGRRAAIIADQYRPAALEAFGYIEQFQAHYEPFARHGVSIRIPSMIPGGGPMVLKWDNGSQIEVFSADTGDIRGGGRHWLLGDELAFWRDPTITLRGALNMVPDLPDTGIILQSTANGVGGEFWDRVQAARDPARSSGWAFVFFGWLEDLNNARSFEDVDYRVRFQRELDSYEANLHTRHGATLEQLHWRRWKVETDFGGDLAGFNQEYPATPEDAFLSTGRPALDIRALERQKASVGVVGELDEIDEYPKKKLWFRDLPSGSLTIWRRPVAGRQYGIGADPSHGIDVSDSRRGDDPDWAVAFVVDIETGEQVAMFRERMRPGAFAERLALLGQAYNWAYLVPEANDAGFIDALLRASYPLDRIYDRRRDPSDRRTARPQEIGFETTTTTRPWLVQALDEALRTGAIIIRSAICLQECRTFVIKPNGKAEHQTGCHDDTVLAAAFACMAIRYAPRRNPRVEAKSTPQGRVFKYGQKAADDDD